MPKRQQPIELTLVTQGLLIGALLEVCSAEIPNFKNRMLERLEGIVSDYPDNQKAIANARELVNSLK